jgi:SAM-dependent methyltransferase
MNREVIAAEKRDIERRYGSWTAHNVRLADDLYSLSSEPTGDEVKLRRVTQVVHDAFGGSIAGLRILDLACLEGMYALEFAARGADVVAIEGREANLAKAQFASRVLGVDDRIAFELGDVRSLSVKRHGMFDVVLCLGILYHLADVDLFPFVERVSEVTRRLLVADTHVALTGTEERTYAGHTYSGNTLQEHRAGATEPERARALWSSLDNLTAWAPTRASLLTLLGRGGFTSAAEVWLPAEPAKGSDRITLAALKSVPQTPIVTPSPAEDPKAVPEHPPLGARLSNGRAWRYGRHLVPRPLHHYVRRALGAETRRH